MRAHEAAVRGATAKPPSAASIASSRHPSSPRRPYRSASAAQPATAPGTVTDRGPVSATGSGIRRGRRRPGGVEPLELAVPPDLREAVAADSGRHRLGDAQDGGGGERRVGGVAAALERAQAGAGRERLARRDHPLRRDRGRAPEREPVAHGDDLRGRAGHPREPRHDRQDALARAEQDVLLEAGRAVRAREQRLVRVRERAGDQLGRDRGVGALGAEQRDDPARAVGVVERERALEPGAEDRRVDVELACALRDRAAG